MAFKNDIAYIIIDPLSITQDMINCIKSAFSFSSITDLAHNNDQTKCVIKFNIDRASAMANKEWLDLGQLMSELQKPEWISGII